MYAVNQIIMKINLNLWLHAATIWDHRNTLQTRKIEMELRISREFYAMPFWRKVGEEMQQKLCHKLCGYEFRAPFFFAPVISFVYTCQFRLECVDLLCSALVSCRIKCTHSRTLRQNISFNHRNFVHYTPHNVLNVHRMNKQTPKQKIPAHSKHFIICTWFVRSLRRLAWMPRIWYKHAVDTKECASCSSWAHADGGGGGAVENESYL